MKPALLPLLAIRSRQRLPARIKRLRSDVESRDELAGLVYPLFSELAPAPSRTFLQPVQTALDAEARVQPRSGGLALLDAGQCGPGHPRDLRQVRVQTSC